MTALRPLVDHLAHLGKRSAKAVYRRPVIETARAWRRVLRATRFIGITGSAGKTTTKELLHAVLAGSGRAVRNDDSNNQLYSIARTLIGTGPATRFVVQEVGASRPGTFEPMLALLRPDVGLVTNVGTDHFKSFRSREGVAAEKCKLIAALPEDGIAVLNADDDHVMGMADCSRARVVTFGTGSSADLRGTRIRSAWPDRLSLEVRWGSESLALKTRMHGRHQAVPVMAAIATACALGVSLHEACAAAGGVEPMHGRMSAYRTKGGINFLRDDWKSPLWSVPFALECLGDAHAERKFVVLGTLSDYGGSSRPAYRRVIEQALTVADHVVVVGERAASVEQRIVTTPPGRLHGFADARQADAWCRTFFRPGDLILIKGCNPVDHLGRLALAFDEEVRCWRRRCGRQIFCDTCRLLGEPAA